MTLRDTLVAELNPRVRARLKAEYLRDLWTAEWPVSGTPTVTRRVGAQNWSIVFDERPKVIRDQDGGIIGIDAMVRVFRGTTELKVDPHRICINPPVLVPDGTTHTVIDPVSGETYEKDNFELNPREAYLRWLVESIRGVPNAAGWRTKGTVTTVFATAPGGNGMVQSLHSTYATARTGADQAAQNEHKIGQLFAASTYFCYESFLIFDTSGIDDGDTVSAVVLSLDGYYDNSVTDFTAGVAASAYDGGAVVPGDWVSGASIPTPELATWSSAGYSAAYNAFTETADFKTAINKTGNTSLILYSQRHRDATQPSGAEWLIFTDADAAGTTTDPKLDITHAAGGGADPEGRLKGGKLIRGGLLRGGVL